MITNNDIDKAVPDVGPQTPSGTEPNAHETNKLLKKFKTDKVNKADKASKSDVSTMTNNTKWVTPASLTPISDSIKQLRNDFDATVADDTAWFIYDQQTDTYVDTSGAKATPVHKGM